MHIAINALSITNRSGTGRYTWGLIHGFFQIPQPDFKLSIIIPADFPIPSAWQHSTQFRFYSIPVRSTFSRIRWEQFSLPRLLRQIQTDALHSPAFIAPVVSDLRIPGVVTIHDLTFERYPSLIPALRRPLLPLGYSEIHTNGSSPPHRLRHHRRGTGAETDPPPPHYPHSSGCRSCSVLSSASGTGSAQFTQIWHTLPLFSYSGNP